MSDKMGLALVFIIMASVLLAKLFDWSGIIFRTMEPPAGYRIETNGKVFHSVKTNKVDGTEMNPWIIGRDHLFRCQAVAEAWSEFEQEQSDLKNGFWRKA
jgi:hypothetical protein